MTLSISNTFAILMMLLAVILFAVTDVAHAAKCEDTYYYVSLVYDSNFKSKRVRAIRFSVNNAYIYDLPFLPSSWVYDSYSCETSCGPKSAMTAAAKSDKHPITYKDFKRFVIIRQPKNKSDNKILIGMSVIYMKKEGGIGTYITKLDNLDNEGFTLEKINKCLPKKPRRH
ncbi:MAG: hypothetical protein H7843_04785 [Nitrospirota bacterium]